LGVYQRTWRTNLVLFLLTVKAADAIYDELREISPILESTERYCKKIVYDIGK